MKSLFHVLLRVSLVAWLLAACRPTPVPTPALTVIVQGQLATLLPPSGAAVDQEIDYSRHLPGTVFFIGENGALANRRVLPELSYPEWDAANFPKGFNIVLDPGHWQKFLLGPASDQQGFLVDVTPGAESTEGAEIVWQVRPEYDGEAWVDVLWLLQPRDALPLPVYARVYTTQGWPVAFQERLPLAPGEAQDFTIGQASAQRGYVVDASPYSTGRPGDTLQSASVHPLYRGGWQDALRILVPSGQMPMQAEVMVYETPPNFFRSEFTQRLKPGEWYKTILGQATDQAAYLVEATPLSDAEGQVESYGVQTAFIDGAWFDILRIKIPADRDPMDVNVRVYAVEPVPNPTPTPLVQTVTPSPLVASRPACPGALISRLQVGQLGVVSFDPPLANRVRIEPDQEAEVLGQIMPGEEFSVLEGPYCADGWAWWRVRSLTQELEGWTVEGSAMEYWLAPLLEPADGGAEQNPITLTAGQVTGANDIEAAIQRSTAHGARPGTVILDGRDGAFMFTGDDRSLNIFVSNLTLRGVNQAVIKDCADGLFFDYLPDSPPENILIEGIEFICEGGGVVASGAFKDVTLRNNIFRAKSTGISIGGASSGWLITENTLEADRMGIEATGAFNMVISNNHISGNLGIALRQCSQFQVEENTIQAAYQGVLLAQQSRENLVLLNTIQGVSHSGIALEPGATGNQVLENEVSCAPGRDCLSVYAAPDGAEMNRIYP